MLKLSLYFNAFFHKWIYGIVIKDNERFLYVELLFETLSDVCAVV